MVQYLYCMDQINYRDSFVHDFDSFTSIIDITIAV